MRSRTIAMCLLSLLTLISITFCIPACGTTPAPSPVTPAPSPIAVLTPVILQIAAADAHSSGSITDAQYAAIEVIISQLNSDIAANGGANITQAQLTSLCTAAALHINNIYFPGAAAARAKRAAAQKAK